MKAKYLFLLSIFVFSLFGCEKSELIEPERPTEPVEPIVPTDEYHYKVPVIFHVLYNNKGNENQYVAEGQMAKLLNLCNQMYANTFNNGDQDKHSVDFNIEFTLATTDPEGKVLPEPGVNRVQWATPLMDCEAFMTEPKETNAALLWNLNRYVNVFIYSFTNNQILGISHIPYGSPTHPLDGLIDGDYYYNRSKTAYPHSVSINNKYIYRVAPSGYYLIDDVSVTLAHELGHYLGLFHSFGASEDGEGGKTDWRADTDYCNDTPNYDRSAYEEWLETYFESTDQTQFSDMVKRTSSEGTTFDAHNIMDYYYCWSDEFTAEQRKRVRHVLAYSPLVPGLKYDAPQTRAILDAEIPPIRVIK